MFVKKTKLILVAAALAAVSLSGHATLVGSTSGSVLTLSDNFNAGAGQCGYIGFVNGNCVSATTQSPDGYLQLGSGLLSQSATAGFSFNTAPFVVGATDITVSFYYSVGLNKDAVFAFDGTTFTLGPTGYNSVNPGAGVLGQQDFFSKTFSSQVLGSHSLLFSVGNGNLRTMRVDDLTISVTAVPEPETYALMLTGLCLMGALVRRRKMKPG